MFFHGMFHPHHNSTGILEDGMQLLSALAVEQELEEARRRHACSTYDDRECDKCCKCRKEEFRG